MEQEGISVIMPSYLGDYTGSRSNPVSKFIRAVKSFIDQDYPKELCELIIISDACQLTIEAYNENFKDIDNIRLIKKEVKSNGYPGKARQMGIDASSFEVITYLDSDDYLLDYRLSLINKFIKNSDVIIDYLRMVKYDDSILNGIENGAVATWQISHKKSICEKVKWEDSLGRGEDTRFARAAVALIPNKPKPWNSDKESYKSYGVRIRKESNIFCKIGGYVICHIPTAKNLKLKPTDI